MEQITKEQIEKLAHLRKRLKKLRSVAVAFSGGVDSTFLLKIAAGALGNRVIARDRIIKAFRKYGFTYITLDLIGYRTGSMNETITGE